MLKRFVLPSMMVPFRSLPGGGVSKLFLLASLFVMFCGLSLFAPANICLAQPEPDYAISNPILRASHLHVVRQRCAEVFDIFLWHDLPEAR
jgi:hypothetical protein